MANIHYNIFETENVRYWQSGAAAPIAIAALIVGASNLTYTPGSGTSGNIYSPPGIAIISSDGHERFYVPGAAPNQIPAWWSGPGSPHATKARIFRWYADI